MGRGTRNGKEREEQERGGNEIIERKKWKQFCI